MSLVQISSTHIVTQLHAHRKDTTAESPLFVAIQGPQGCGKTYLTSQLRQVLESPSHALSVAILSIDDLYLPYSDLVALSEAHPKNKLLKGRGQPGTHDLELGRKLLEDLKHINEPTTNNVPREVALPSFDKSLHGGVGDRVKRTLVKRAPVDVVIMEGWCVGFCPITTEDIDKRWSESADGLSNDALYTLNCRKEDVVEINQMLKAYVDWWHYFHVCIQVC
jgi:D-glycerate 3-kinase